MNIITRAAQAICAALVFTCTPLLAQDIESPQAEPDTLSIPLSWNEQMEVKLATIASDCDSLSYLTGICVWDLTGDSLLFGYNHRKVMRPASTQKILTAIAALDILGASHEVRTTLTTDSEGTPKAILRGMFDPLLTASDLRSMASALVAQLGAERCADLRIQPDDSMKEPELYGSGWCWDDVPSRFEMPLSPLMFDRGRIHEDDRDSIPCNKDHYALSPLHQPAQYTADYLERYLHSLSRGMLSDSTLTDSAIATSDIALFTTSTSRTVQQILQRMMKNSDNLHAESLFYNIAFRASGKRATAKAAAREIESTMRRAGANPAFAKIADGSGVSLYNYHTPEAQVLMLRYAFGKKQIYPYLYPALPVAARDGTLDDRMRGTTAALNVHAKTGTVTGVSSLSGYCTASNGHQLCFSIICNGCLSAKSAKNLQDRICIMLTE